MRPPLFSSWAGACDHQGHTITFIEQWPQRDDLIRTFERDGQELGEYRRSVGRVRCSCGDEWDIGAVPNDWKPPTPVGLP